ncbi:MAG: hypothetical protein M1826_000161 [Phylliscum demangeonii]|nr:MAG: hypothetical protein M1826_000161 [Phylliscum demangeonii]
MTKPWVHILLFAGTVSSVAAAPSDLPRPPDELTGELAKHLADMHQFACVDCIEWCLHDQEPPSLPPGSTSPPRLPSQLSYERPGLLARIEDKPFPEPRSRAACEQYCSEPDVTFVFFFGQIRRWVQAKARNPPRVWNAAVQLWFDRTTFLVAIRASQEFNCKNRGDGAGPERDPADPSGQAKDLTDDWYGFLQGRESTTPDATVPGEKAKERALARSPSRRLSRNSSQRWTLPPTNHSPANSRPRNPSATIQRGSPEFQYITSLVHCVMNELRPLASNPRLLFGQIQETIGTKCGAQSRFLKGSGQMAARLDRAFQQHGLAGQRQAIEDALTTVLKFDLGIVSAIGHALHHLGWLDGQLFSAVYAFLLAILIFILGRQGKVL